MADVWGRDGKVPAMDGQVGEGGGVEVVDMSSGFYRSESR